MPPPIVPKKVTTPNIDPCEVIPKISAIIGEPNGTGPPYARPNTMANR